MAEQVILEPHWPNVIRWHANALTTHSFEVGARGPISTFMQMVGHLAQKDPAELNRIIEEFAEPVVEGPSYWDPDGTPTGGEDADSNPVESDQG